MNLIKNKYLFFLFRIIRDITRPTRWPIQTGSSGDQLGHYYFLFDEAAVRNQKGGQKSIVFDDDGIPVNPTYIDVKDKDFVYFPITIGQVGLAVYHTWLRTGSEDDKKRFMKYVDWFFVNAENKKTTGVRWLTEVALPQYKNPGPWQSAFAQSRGISVLLRGYQLTGNRDYMDLAEQALIPFTLPVHDGGVTSQTKSGPFYEEYTAAVPTLVLNGMIFTMCGLHEFCRIWPDHTTAKKLYEQGVDTLIKILPEYDLGYWSRYNLCEAKWYPGIDPATVTYQHLHVTQMDLMYRITGNTVFNKYYEIFKNQIRLKNMIQMYKTKHSALKTLGRI